MSRNIIPVATVSVNVNYIRYLTCFKQEYAKINTLIFKGVAYGEATEAANRGSCLGKKYMQKKNVKTIKFYFHVLNKGTINKYID